MLLFAGVFPWGSSLNGICILLQKCWIVTLLSVFQFSVIWHKMKQPPPKTKMKFRWMQQLIIDNFIQRYYVMFGQTAVTYFQLFA